MTATQRAMAWLNAVTISRSRCCGGELSSPRIATIIAPVSRHSSLCRRNRIDSLFGKYWYSEPTLTPARSATRTVVKRRAPSSRKT